MKHPAAFFFGYGLFLIVIGLAGFLSNPDSAKTALISGGFFGAVSIGIGVLAKRKWRMARVVGLGLSAFLGLVFVWRASVSWMAFLGGQSEKFVAAVLISAMLAATIGLAIGLLRRPAGGPGTLPSVPG